MGAICMAGQSNPKVFFNIISPHIVLYCSEPRDLISSPTCSSLSSPKEMPPDIRTVAVSGTLNTFQPRLSKKVARWACPVVFPPQGPPVSTSLWILRLGGIGSYQAQISPLYWQQRYALDSLDLVSNNIISNHDNNFLSF